MTTLTKPTLHGAISALAAQNTDWAQIRNGVGFNKSDSWLGASLASLPESEWTAEMRWTAWNLLRKYAKQLARYSIVYDEIPKPEKPAVADDVRQVARSQVWKKAGAKRVAGQGKIERTNGGFTISFPYDANTVTLVKTIPGRTFDGRTKSWFVPETEDGLVALAKFSADTGITSEDSDLALILDEAVANYVEKPAKRIDADSEPGTVQIHFPYDERLVDEIKSAGAKWDRTKRIWRANLDTTAAALGPFIRNFGFHVEPEIAVQIEVAVAKASERREASSAQDAEIEVPLLGAILRPFQKAGVAYLIESDGAILGDEMGLGKTPQAAASAEVQQSFPFLCVVPNLAKRNWLREIDFWLPERSASILDGSKKQVTVKQMLLSPEKRHEFEVYATGDDGEDLQRRAEYALRYDDKRRRTRERSFTANDLTADLLVVNYDIIGRKPSGRLAAALVEFFEANGMTPLRDGHPIAFNDAKLFEFLVAFKLRAATADESHYLKNPKAQRTVAFTAIADAVLNDDGHVWLLTGTPILNRPVELVPQLRAIHMLDRLGGFYGYVKRYCGAFYDGHGLDTSGAQNLEELNRRLRETCYVRRNKRDVLTELDAVQRSSLDFPLTDPKAYRAVADDVITWVRERAARDASFLAEIADLDEEMRKQKISEHKKSAEARAARAEILVRLNALRLVAAQQKLPAVIEWLNEWLEENPDEKIIVFAWHREIQQSLLRAFPKAAQIVAEDEHGRTVKPEVRSAQVLRCPEEPGWWMLVASIMASGVSLTLTAATTVAFTELPWRPGDIDQCEGRAYGRLNDAHGINSYYLLGEETIDADMAQLIDVKREVVDEATTGVKGTSGKGIVESLVKRLLSLDDLEEAA